MRLIDADALKQKFYDVRMKVGLLGINDIYDVIDDAPTADVVEVVRCKDCKYSLDYYNDGDCYCKTQTREMLWMGSTWDGFCSYGERRKE